MNPLVEVTVENAISKKEEIVEVKDTYEKLTAVQKDLVETEAKDKLVSAEDKLRAAEIKQKIKAVKGVTVENAAEKKSAIEEARREYDKLTAEQKKLITADELKNLTDAEKIYADLKNKKAAQAVEEKIKKIGQVTSKNAAKKKTLIDDAEKAYNALTKEQKTLVSETAKKALEDAKTAYQKAIQTSGNNNQNLEAEKATQIKDISNKLNVSQKTAAKIQELTNKFGVAMETLLIAEKDIAAQKTEKDLKGSTYGKLQAQSTKVSSKQIKLTWKKVKGADGYLIYGTTCGKGKPYKLLKEIKKGSTQSCTLKKLKKGTFYRFLVRAYKQMDGQKVTIAASKSVHIVTDGGKNGNVKNIKVNKTKATLKKGKSMKLKASEIKKNKALKKHRILCYESSNEKIATVTKTGIVKAKAKGKCTIYVYAQNGVCKKVTITVK